MARATSAGTERYKNRWKDSIPEAHFRAVQNLFISSIGVGTYLGEMNDETDHRYITSIQTAIELGCNIVDTAINYRFQRSERNVGVAVKQLIDENRLSRDEVVVSTKGGFLSFDSAYPANPSKYIQDEYITTGVCKADEIVAGCHCMSPSYLENQLDRSLKNLQLDCIDIYFIHNPETQLSEVSRQEFLKRMMAAFKLLERKVEEGKIQTYGTATWNGYRDHEGGQSYLSLEELIGLARNAGGENHHFRAIQLPLNLAMPEAFLNKNQKFGSRSVSLLEAAHHHGMIVLSSASILQGQLARNLPGFVSRFFENLQTDAQRSIQFPRSTIGVTTALVGMSSPAHVRENMEVAKTLPVPWEKMKDLFTA